MWVNWHGLLTSVMFLRNSWLTLRNRGTYCNQLTRIRRFRKSDLLFAGQNFIDTCFPCLHIWGSAVLGPMTVTCLVSGAAEHSGKHYWLLWKTEWAQDRRGDLIPQLLWMLGLVDGLQSCLLSVASWLWLSRFFGQVCHHEFFLKRGINKTQPKEDLLLPLLHRHLRTWSNVHK